MLEADACSRVLRLRPDVPPRHQTVGEFMISFSPFPETLRHEMYIPTSVRFFAWRDEVDWRSLRPELQGRYKSHAEDSTADRLVVQSRCPNAGLTTFASLYRMKLPGG
jgi:hypothetical protein